MAFQIIFLPGILPPGIFPPGGPPGGRVGVEVGVGVCPEGAEVGVSPGLYL